MYLIVQFSEIIRIQLTMQLPIDALYLNFQKAFDKVPHLRLVSKLQIYGIDKKLLAWIHCFLSSKKLPKQDENTANSIEFKIPILTGII